jgi:hypothetical protein
LRDHLGLESTLLPNIFDFAMAAPGMTDFNRDLRASLGLTDNHLLILQPTRVIARKGIELSIELVRRMREAPWKVTQTNRSETGSSTRRTHRVPCSR